MSQNSTADRVRSAPVISEEQRELIRQAAQRIAATAPDHFTAEQRDLIGRTWVRALRRSESTETAA